LPRVWRLIDEALPAWRAWGEEVVVYNDATGDTHRLDATMALAFHALREGPIGPASLSGRLAPALGPGTDDELAEAAHSILAHLEQLELAERTDE
jgi:PqqD family protein of HPr-rel-A system